MKLISGFSLADVWLQGCQHLLEQPSWTDTTVVLHVSNPLMVKREDKAMASALNQFLIEHDRHSNHTVAETIFPGYEYVHRGVAGVYAYPEDIFPGIKRHPDSRSWGTYAQRLLHRVDADGQAYNPLESCIKKMKQKQPVRAAYEVGLGYGFDLSTYDDDDDRAHRMAGPCLSHLSFKLIKKTIHLTAIYRSHYYLQRAYGNLLGLARLQSFVADQVGVAVGPLACHSTMAVLEHGKEWGWRKTEVPPLIETCVQLMRGLYGAHPPKSDPPGRRHKHAVTRNS